MNTLDLYLRTRNQTEADLYGGASTFGFDFIEKELVPKAIEENKKIIWIDEVIDGEYTGNVTYALQDF
jgi:hypothetical protein